MKNEKDDFLNQFMDNSSIRFPGGSLDFKIEEHPSIVYTADLRLKKLFYRGTELPTDKLDILAKLKSPEVGWLKSNSTTQLYKDSFSLLERIKDKIEDVNLKEDIENLYNMYSSYFFSENIVPTEYNEKLETIYED